MSSAVLSFKPKQRRPIGHVFVTFYNGPKDMDAVTARLETEKGLNSHDTVMAVHRFGDVTVHSPSGSHRSMRRMRSSSERRAAGLRIDANRILRLACLADSTPT
jgi:hypothetical protein